MEREREAPTSDGWLNSTKCVRALSLQIGTYQCHPIQCVWHVEQGKGWIGRDRRRERARRPTPTPVDVAPIHRGYASDAILGPIIDEHRGEDPWREEGGEV
jgi:hypothetical protein